MGEVKGYVKEKAGFAKEEFGEAIDDKEMAEEGRKLRNEGKLEQGKAPKLTPVGQGHKDKDSE